MFRALASGSSGNAYLLKTEKVTLLFEAGLRLPVLERYLLAEEIRPGGLSGILISHEHRDHCGSAADLATEWDTALWANERVLLAAGLAGHPGAGVLAVGRPILLGDVEVTSFPVPHDASCPVGFRIQVQNRTIVLSTDLGSSTPEVAAAVQQGDLVVLESNHDSDMLHGGRYPYLLRKRVGGPNGHLSNSQAGDVLSRCVKSEDVDVWLAHLSRNNNTPQIALQTVRRALAAVGLERVALAVAMRDRPSLRWAGEPRPRQLPLFASSDVLAS